jgi:hypothetical protein
MAERTSAQKRAAAANIKKAQEARARKQREKALAKMDEDLENLKDKVETKVEDKVDKAVKEYLGKVNRSKLKDEFLQVFHDMGGRGALKKWAKDHQTEYYKMMTAMLKAETEKEGGGGGGVTVNFDFGDTKPETINITPDKPSEDNGSNAT